MFILAPPARATKTTTEYPKGNPNLNALSAHMKIQNLSDNV